MSETLPAPPKIRLYLPTDFAAGRDVAPSFDQAHYLLNVMRLKPGAEIGVFNGRDGEWAAEIVELSRKRCSLCLLGPVRPHRPPPDVWLLFAPLKRGPTDFLVQKATELGAGVLQPVVTRRTVAERVRTDRLAAIAVEAAEQCTLTAVPEVREPVDLMRLLADWDPARRLVFCDEARAGAATVAATGPAALAGFDKGDPWAILIGPEGGFDPAEAAHLRSLPFVVPMALGPRIMRADTAAIAALTVWQGALGDWD